MLAVAAVVLVACNPDPTNGARPPGAGAGPAYTSSVRAATREELPHSWRVGCPVHWSNLSVVRVAYWGYDGARHVGDLVVHDSWAPAVRRVFGDLYAHRFQIRRIHPVEVYGGSDARSMDANNTSAFNCRYVAGTTTWSEHAYGRALDLNPHQNPYVSGSYVSPTAGRSWLDRSSWVPGMVDNPTIWYFGANGWRWGGSWSTKKDYMHFSSTGR